MRSILLISWANIKRRKLQTVMVAICIALTAMLFYTLLSVYRGMDEPFDKLQKRLNASHILMRFDQNVHSPDKIIDWFERQPQVAHVTKPKLAKFLAKRPIVKGKEFEGVVLLVEHLGNHIPQDQIDILQGDKKDFPAPGEIWIPNHWLNHIELSVGDSVHIPTDNGLFPLKVSAIIVEPHYSSGLSNGNPVFVGPGTLAMLFPVSQLSSVQVGIKMKNISDIEPIWAKFSQEVQFSGICMRYKTFKLIFQVLYQFIAGLLTVFAILGILITIIISITVINSSIRSDYKIIGMLKSQGFTNWNINLAYLNQFFWIALLSVPFGLIGGYYMTRLIFKSLITAIGAVNFDFSLWIPAAWTFFTFLVGILVITYFIVRKTKSISPITAIRYGGPPPKHFRPSKSRWFSLRPNSKLPIFLGWRFLLSNKKRAVTLFVCLFFTIFVQLLYVNGKNSSFDVRKNRSAWGLEEAALLVSKGLNAIRFETDAFREDMEKDDRIDKIVPFSYYAATLKGTKDEAPDFFGGRIYDDDLDKLGLEVVQGRHPVFEDEISIGVNSAKELEKSLGDTLAIFIEGQFQPYLITGIFQAIDNLGKGFQMRLEGIQKHNPLYKPNIYAIRLEKDASPFDFKSDIIKTYGTTYDVRNASDMEITLGGILNGLEDVILMVSLLFLTVLMATVFNDTVLSIKEHQKDLGIYKAIGMSPIQLQMALLFKASIVAIIALLIGIPLASYSLEPSLSYLTKDVGLVKVPYIHSWTATLWTIPLILGLTMGSAWIASLRVVKIKPNVLVRE